MIDELVVEKHVLPDHFEFSPDMLFRRSIAGHHMHRQEEVTIAIIPLRALLSTLCRLKRSELQRQHINARVSFSGDA